MNIWSKLKGLTRLQRVTLILFVAMIVNSILDSTIGYQLLGGDLLGVLFTFSLFFLILSLIKPLTRRLVWRVRNRLLVTYVLFGVVPIALIFVMLGIGSYILFGQIAANLVREEIQRLTDNAVSAARAVALLSDRPEDALRLFPGMSVVVRSGSSLRDIPVDGIILDIPSWITPGFKGVVQRDTTFMLAAAVRLEAAGHRVDVLAYSPIDSKMLGEFDPDLGAVSVYDTQFESADGGVRLSESKQPSSGFRFTTSRRGQDNPNPQARPIVTSARTLPEPRGFWDFQVEWPSILAVTRLDGTSHNAILAVASRASMFIPRLFSSLGTIAPIMGYALLVIAFIFLFVEVISLMLSAGLTRSITRAVHDLYLGTKKVANADFSHRIPVRSRDQLSELAASFNGMTEQIRRLIDEVKEKEKLEAELEIAREVQAQLFPKGIPQLKTLELAGVCNPARVVSGDYYDFVPIAARYMAIVIADISGKGISAALLMASVQSSLHAQLTNRENGETPSTATLVARLNRQLYENTPPEKYATFYCSIYDDQSGCLAYTNAGHLPPILVRSGNASRLEGNGIVVGILPDAPYEQVVIQLQPGDLLAAFTDGITESENEKGEEFGETRLAGLLVEHAAKPLDRIVEIVTQTVREWAYDFDNRDDTTMLLARRV